MNHDEVWPKGHTGPPVWRLSRENPAAYDSFFHDSNTLLQEPMLRPSGKRAETKPSRTLG